MWPNQCFPADLVTFTEEICKTSFFLCSDAIQWYFPHSFQSFPVFCSTCGRLLEILIQNKLSAVTKVVTQGETMTLAIFYAFWSCFSIKSALCYSVLKWLKLSKRYLTVGNSARNGRRLMKARKVQLSVRTFYDGATNTGTSSFN